MMLSILLGANAGVLAETEREAKAKSTGSQASSIHHMAPAVSIGSVDFRRPSIPDGTFGVPSSGAFTAFGIGMFVASGADLASTEFGLSRPGIQEANPLQRNRNVRILSHVAAPALMYWMTEKLHDKGRTKTALFARIGFNVAYSYVVMHNLRTAALNP
jgi:hypothetical protein